MKNCFCFAIVTLVYLAYTASANGVKHRRDICESGNDGSIKWELHGSDEELVISGTGEIYQSSTISQLVKGSCKSFKNLVFEGCFITLGDDSFTAGFRDKVVQILNSNMTLKYKSFSQCALDYLSIQNSTVVIEKEGFFQVNQLKKLFISESIVSIGVDNLIISGFQTMVINRSNVTIEKQHDDHRTPLSVSITSSEVFIADSAFENYYPLQTMTVLDSNTLIGENAFQNCVQLNNVTIKNGYASIGTGAFSNCHALMTVTIDNAMTSIGESAFKNCYQLDSITIPETVSSIGESAFEGCTNLNSVFYQGSSFFSSNAFPDMDNMDICSSPQYNYSSFCNKNLTANASLCIEFRDLFSHCSKPAYVNGTFIMQYWKNIETIRWKKENGCVEYDCNGDNGIIKPSLCADLSNALVCVDGECVEGKQIDTKTGFEIELPGLDNVTEMTSDELKRTIAKESGTDENVIVVAWIADEDGRIVRVVVYVSDLEASKKIESFFESCSQTNNS